MIDNLKKILNEDQDPKAIEKITSKLENLLMSNEEVGYIAVQKKPAITVFPDSIVVTNKRIILCKPKNLGLSMEFVDYDWDDVAGTFVKEGILGSDFTFSTKTELTHTVDYLPKNQARKLYTYAKEQMDLLKNPKASSSIVEEIAPVFDEVIEEVPTEEVTHFAEIMPIEEALIVPDTEVEAPIPPHEKKLSDLSKDELFEKLNNYKKLLDNGLILQGEYDKLKNEILPLL
ncbi:PH domain-containing protein [Flavobacterium urocaniciphilum]|uniref:PH domain-containing protein n=1 Tax=Flavobacterium urocaniciphilum TaxID=1299341 RepID=A0A1H9AFW1_9FLAO|nr:PH domain-containing protein [Flavobacterium urocaniciphilum]SEP75616.1 PH domain-containing protein [Flavobacterium urocaniciphilum]